VQGGDEEGSRYRAVQPVCATCNTPACVQGREYKTLERLVGEIMQGK
jgi:hypothetical protein